MLPKKIVITESLLAKFPGDAFIVIIFFFDSDRDRCWARGYLDISRLFIRPSALAALFKSLIIGDNLFDGGPLRRCPVSVRKLNFAVVRNAGRGAECVFSAGGDGSWRIWMFGTGFFGLTRWVFAKTEVFLQSVS